MHLIAETNLSLVLGLVNFLILNVAMILNFVYGSLQIVYRFNFV